MSDTYEIAVLAEDYEHKKMIFEHHKMQGLPEDPQERIKAGVAYHVAEGAMLEAYNLLSRAKWELSGRLQSGSRRPSD